MQSWRKFFQVLYYLVTKTEKIRNDGICYFDVAAKFVGQIYSVAKQGPSKMFIDPSDDQL